LNKSDIREQPSPRWSPFVPDRLQQEARDRAIVGATLAVRAGDYTPPGIVAAQTLLLSKELCQVAFPLSGGTMPSLGFSLMRAKWVMISSGCPKMLVKRVASGRAGLTVHDMPPVCAETRVVAPRAHPITIAAAKSAIPLAH
jgi:hypothetical protein